MPLWGFKYVDVEVEELSLFLSCSFYLSAFSSSRSESSETLFAIPSSRKLTVQPPGATPAASQLPFPLRPATPYVLGCYGSSGRFLCSNTIASVDPTVAENSIERQRQREKDTREINLAIQGVVVREFRIPAIRRYL